MARKKTEPGIHKRGRRWQVDTFYKGVRLRDSFSTYLAAEKSLRKMKTDIDEGRYLDKKQESKVTLGDFAKRYLDWCLGVGQKAVASKKSHVEKILAHFGRDTQLGRISRAEVERYQAELNSASCQKGRPIKPATTNRRIACLKHMFSKAVEWKDAEGNPCRGVTQLRENNRRLRFLTSEECQNLLESCPNPTLRQVVELALNTGMRKSEILHLRWKHVNLAQGYLEILDQKNGDYSTVPLNQDTVALLRSIPHRLDSDFVFTGRLPGKPFFDLKRQFEKAIGKSRLSDCTFHTLRHTAASHLVMSGADLTTVKEILRHKSIETTMRYAHLSPEHKRSAVEGLGRSLKDDVGKRKKTA